ncbi:hypothetical protein [Rufibacter tibetensis]|uniref:Uncharacterized protein n=1 Tax=Rufibacter tibetensis TaxID=512763 RepID=A0A0P0CHY1_9BACT|nr:hypothetical protein [Rufibacter tibetensis]ALI98927.1 hypothetical protein DC20_07975 [Rufibacter tibetensis]
MELLTQLAYTSQRLSNCLPYVPLNQLSDVTSFLCLLVRHANDQEKEKFYELNSRFLHIIEIVETIRSEYQKPAVAEQIDSQANHFTNL